MYTTTLLNSWACFQLSTSQQIIGNTVAQLLENSKSSPEPVQQRRQVYLTNGPLIGWALREPIGKPVTLTQWYLC